MIKYCLFPVAGLGTRLLPVTKSIPKEMIPILSKPLIQYAVEEAYDLGIDEHIFITNNKKKSIELFFKTNNFLDSKVKGKKIEEALRGLNKLIMHSSFTFINQEKMLGLGHAILMGEKKIDSPFAVILPDDLCHNKVESVLQQMLKVHEIYPGKSIIAVEEVDYEDVENYGVIDGNCINQNPKIYNVKRMVEKPRSKDAPSTLAIIGRYILQPEIFNIIKEIDTDEKGEIQITNALDILAKDNKVIALKFQGKRIDCGSYQGIIEANNYFNNS